MRLLLVLACLAAPTCCYLPAPAPSAPAVPGAVVPGTVAPAVPVAPTAPPAGGATVAPVLPDSLAPLGEGGEMVPDSAGSATRTYRFSTLDFATVQARTATFMAANGWTMVPGSETNSESVAAILESIGQAEAARLARATPSFGASYQHPLSSATVAINIGSISGPLELSITWF